MATCNKTEIYYKGEDIEFYLTPTEEFEDLDGQDWQLLFKSSANKDLVLRRDDMTMIEANNYYGIIGHEITKGLIPDKFTAELMYGTQHKNIGISLVFELQQSNSAKYI